jgi:hypothetical protein
LSRPIDALKSQLHPDDRARLAEIMARNNFRDDDAVLLAIAECLAIASGVRHLHKQTGALTDSAIEATRQSNNAARNAYDAAMAVDHLLSDPQTMKKVGGIMRDAHVEVAKITDIIRDARAEVKREIDQLKQTMATAALPRWVFAAAVFVGALAVSIPILWRIEDLRRNDTIIMAAQGARIDQCTIPKDMPVRHDPAVGRYIVCAEREPPR